jgi:hypothetical protein
MAMWSRSILRRLIGLRAIESGTSGLRQSGVGYYRPRNAIDAGMVSSTEQSQGPKVPLSASACEVSALAMALSQTHRYVRWYLACNRSLAILEEMMAERGICVDHFTIHRRIVRFSPRLLERFNRRKCAVTGKWRMDETYIKVRGRWMYIYRTIDSVGDSVELLFSEHRDLLAGMSSTQTSSSRTARSTA